MSELSKRTATQLSKSRISNYEQGLRRMGLEAACELAAALETVTPAWLLWLDEDAPLSEEELRLVERFRTLDEGRRQRLLTRIADVITPPSDRP